MCCMFMTETCTTKFYCFVIPWTRRSLHTLTRFSIHTANSHPFDSRPVSFALPRHRFRFPGFFFRRLVLTIAFLPFFAFYETRGAVLLIYLYCSVFLELVQTNGYQQKKKKLKWCESFWPTAPLPWAITIKRAVAEIYISKAFGWNVWRTFLLNFEYVQKLSEVKMSK